MIPGGGGRGGKSSFFTNLVIFLSILGPGIITGSVDNDAGGITTYSVAGAHYGYRLLWTLLPAFVVLLVVQEMNARMGIVTGKGLADLIRENFGVKVTFYIFVGLLVADIGNTATEFAGVAGSMQIFGVSKYIAVPLAAVAVWILVVKGTYKIAERIFLVFSVFLLSYVVSAIMARPHWSGDRAGDDPALVPVRPPLPGHGHRHHRHHHRPLDAVLHAVGGHRKTDQDQGLPLRLLGRGHRLRRHRHRRFLHHRRLRLHPA